MPYKTTKQALEALIKDEGLIDGDTIADRARNSHFIGSFSRVNLGKDFLKYRNNPEVNKFSDKYRHAMVNCRAAQRGVFDALTASDLSGLKEKYDIYSGGNTQEESDEDMNANYVGRFLGIKYPEGDCDELIQRYINKKY